MATKKEQLYKKYSIFNIVDIQNLWEHREYELKLDRAEFIEWHGTSSISKVVEMDLLNILNGNDNNFKLEAKIISGELEKYPFEDRTTEDGYVSVDFIDIEDGKFVSKLDDYHSNFLIISNEFRVVNTQCSVNNIKYNTNS